MIRGISPMEVDSESVNHFGGLHIPGSSVDKKDCPFGWKEFKCEA